MNVQIPQSIYVKVLELGLFTFIKNDMFEITYGSYY